MQWIVEPLSKNDTSSFFSGDAACDAYLKQKAGSDTGRGFASVFVAASSDAPQMVLGYYTLAASSLDIEDLPPDLRVEIPQFRHVPAVCMERIALASSMQGHGHGELLLVDALLRAYRGSLGWAVFLVVCEDAKKAGFFKQYGFSAFAGASSLLWLTRREVHKLPGAETD